MSADRSTIRAQQATGIAATLVNFPVVFAGLLAITIGAEGNVEVALLNLWALWGIAQGLLGQIAQVSGVLDGRHWTDVRAMRLIPQTAVPAALAALLLSDTWFPGHESWWIAVLLLVTAVVVIGRQRAVLARRLDGTHALVVTALENSIRSASVIILLLAAAERDGLVGWGAVAIVGPFIVSIALLANRIEADERETPARRDAAASTSRSVSSGVLSGIPALAGYAIVPGLTLLDQTDDLGSIAVAASLLRGPLLVATFLAPVLLQQWVVLRTDRVGGRLLVVPVAIVVVQLVAGLVGDDDSIGQLIVQTVLAGAAAVVTYLLILRLLTDVTASGASVLASILASLAFALVLAVSATTDRLHPFAALGVACAVIVLVIARAAPRKAPVT